MTRPDYRKRITALNPALNAFIDLTDEQQGEGLSWAVKSNIAVKGLPWTAGIGAYRARIASQDAEVIRRIRASGGMVLGTVNMHEGALGATTNNRWFGRTHNPWSKDLTPGGSSGGSGAAVAAGLCDVALGTDTMGSVRIPAAYCGVQGHKPTTGLVPLDGVVALSHTLDHVGPLARDVDTLWTAMHVLAGWGDAPALTALKLSDLRVGIWDGGGDICLHLSVEMGFKLAIEGLRAAGARTAPFTPGVYAAGVSRRAGLLISEREGHAEHAARLEESPDGFSRAFRDMLDWGARQPQDRADNAYAHVADVRAAAAAAFETLDIVIAPTAPQQAFGFGSDVPSNQADFTAWANLAALPATALFCGLAKNGLPLSVQIIGRQGADRSVLQVAAALEVIFGRPPAPPGYA